MKQPRSLLTITGVLAAAVVALGCGAGADTGTVSEGSSAEAAASESKAQVAKMGTGVVTFGDGVAVAVKKPAKYTPSGTAAGHKRGNSAFVVEVRITNGGKEPLDLTLVTATAAIGAEGVQAERVFDSAKGLTDFEGTLAPGQKRTAKLAFSAPTKDTTKIALTVSPSFDGSTALFEGAL